MPAGTDEGGGIIGFAIGPVISPSHVCLEGDVAEGKARYCRRGAVRKVQTTELEGCKTPNENGVKYRMEKV